MIPLGSPKRFYMKHLKILYRTFSSKRICMFGSQKAGADERSVLTSCCQRTTTNNHLNFSCTFAFREEQRDLVEQSLGQMARCEQVIWWCRCSLNGQTDVSFSSFSKQKDTWDLKNCQTSAWPKKCFEGWSAMIYIYASGKRFLFKTLHCILKCIHCIQGIHSLVHAFSRNRTHDLGDPSAKR